MHALYDWTVIFSEMPDPDVVEEIYYFDPLWQTIKDSFAYVLFDVSAALVLLSILWVCRRARVPRVVIQLAKHLKLIEDSSN